MSALTQTTLLGATSCCKLRYVVALKCFFPFCHLGNFFFTVSTRAVIRREGKGVREAFGSVRVAVKLNALDFVRFERGRFLRGICSRCCCVFVRARAFR